MTRAWPTVPFTRRKTRATQNQAMASRRIFCCVVSFSSTFAGCARLVFMRHRDRAIGLNGCSVFQAGILKELAIRTAFANFELHEVGRINARITRRTEVALGVTDGLLQTRHGNVAKRICAEEFANFGGSV